MQHDIRFNVFENAPQVCAAADIGERRIQQIAASGLPHFEINLIQIEFRIIHKRKQGRIETCRLAHQFRPDCAARAGDQNALACDKFSGRSLVYLSRRPGQKSFKFFVCEIDAAIGLHCCSGLF